MAAVGDRSRDGDSGALGHARRRAEVRVVSLWGGFLFLMGRFPAGPSENYRVRVVVQRLSHRPAVRTSFSIAFRNSAARFSYVRGAQGQCFQCSGDKFPAAKFSACHDRQGMGSFTGESGSGTGEPVRF
jgi:hypothetical protein